MKAILRFLFLIFIFLINYQICKSQVVVTKNLTAGVNLLKEDGANLSINFALTLPPNTSNVSFEFENSDTVNTINPYSINFSTQTWTFPQATGNAYTCTQSYGLTTTPAVGTTFSAQTIPPLGNVTYSCPSSPTNKLAIKYTSTSVGSLSVYAIVNTNSLNLTTPPIPSNASASINATNANNGGSYSQSKFLGTVADAPLAITLHAANGTESAAARNLVKQLGGQAVCSASTSCPGLFVADAGYVQAPSGTTTITTGNNFVTLWNSTQGNNGVIQTCQFEVFGSFSAGAAGTLDIFVQDSTDGTNYNDRIHFTQITNNTLRLVAGIAGTSANMAITPVTSGILAAGSITSGPLGAFGRALLVVAGGTAPQYATYVNANCK